MPDVSEDVIRNDPADIENAFESGMDEGAAAERASIVAWIRTGLMRIAGQNPDDAALFRLVATMIERGDHASAEDERGE